VNPAVRSALALFVLWCAAFPSHADLVQEVNRIRATGCDGKPSVHALRLERKLQVVARLLSRGTALRDAIREAGYGAASSASIRIANRGDESAAANLLRRRFCARVMNPSYREIGGYRRGDERWLVLAAPFEAPKAGEASEVGQRVLGLVNQARSRARRCGNQRFSAAGPLKLVPALGEAARAHAEDMARYGYLEHTGRDGSTPGDRLKRTGYQRRLVGENIAAGPATPEEAVQGWLDSPEHCANIMDSRFRDMGVAYKLNRSSRHGVYWAQVLAAPR
jgi:uncharacterized protein YkwD